MKSHEINKINLYRRIRELYMQPKTLVDAYFQIFSEFQKQTFKILKIWK